MLTPILCGSTLIIDERVLFCESSFLLKCTILTCDFLSWV